MDFQTTLARLKEKLENDFQFRKSTLAGGKPICQSTEPIALFVAWLENTPEAQQVLKELDFTSVPYRAKNR